MSNCFELVYKKAKKTRIFGKKFLKRNKYKFKIVYNNKEYSLKEFFEEIDKNCKQGREIKFKLRFLCNIYNLSGMFLNCVKLISMKNDVKEETICNNNDDSKTDNIENVFSSSEKRFYDLYDSREPTVSNIHYNSSSYKNSFSRFTNLLSSQKIKVTSIDNMFNGCKSLISLPDLSKWNTKNVTQLNGMFNGCKSLISLPDLSKWNTEKVTYMNSMFYKCELLISLSDLSKWNTKNVTRMDEMFYGCSSLISLPDLSKWNTEKVTYMDDMFAFCSSLKSLPDLSKWDNKNVEHMNSMFYECNSLISLPDLSKWNTNNVKSKSRMLEGCFNTLIKI